MDKASENKIKMHYVDIDSLHGSPQNPRYWSDEAKEQLKNSIRRFGLTEPLLVNSYPKRKNRIISGHFRWTVAKELGIKTVPVIFLNIASLEKERELLLRMNANQGAWDYALLKSFDTELLLDVGFGDSDLSHIWDETLEIENDNFDEEKEIKKIKRTDIKTGDHFMLGPNHLICGDACDLETVKKLTGDSKIDMIDIDMPFNIGLDYDKGVGNKSHYGGQTNDNKTDEEYRIFVKTIMRNALSVSKLDCHAFFWCDERYVWLFQELFKESGLDSKRLCIWIKDNALPTPGSAFNKITEYCVYGVRGVPFLSDKVKNLNEIMNKEMSSGNRLTEEILDALNIWLVKRLPANQYQHPSQKNPTLHEKALRRCTRPSDKVLDLTAGSGSFLIAAHQLKRVAYLCDREAIFCQLTINRFKQFSNEKVKKLN